MQYAKYAKYAEYAEYAEYMQNMQNMQNMHNKTYLVSKIFNLELHRIFAALLPTRGSSSSSSVSTFPGKFRLCWEPQREPRGGALWRWYVPPAMQCVDNRYIIASYHKISSAKFFAVMGIAANSSTFYFVMSRGSTWGELGAAAGAASGCNTLLSVLISNCAAPAAAGASS